MAHVCPNCGGSGYVEKAIEPVLEYDGATFTLGQGTILAILLAANGKPVRASDLYTRYASTRNEPPTPQTVKVQISYMRAKLRACGSLVEIRRPAYGMYQLIDVSRETSAQPIGAAA